MSELTIQIVAYVGCLTPEERPARVEPVYRVVEGDTEAYFVGGDPFSAPEGTGDSIDKDELQFQISLREYSSVDPPIPAVRGCELVAMPEGVEYAAPDSLRIRLHEVWGEMLGLACKRLFGQMWDQAFVPLCQAYCAKRGDPAAEILLAAFYRQEGRTEEWNAAREHLLAGAPVEQLRKKVAERKRPYSKLHQRLPDLLSDVVDDLDAAADADKPWSGTRLHAQVS